MQSYNTFKHLFESKDEAEKYLKENKVFYTEFKCTRPNCNGIMRVIRQRNVLRCGKKTCSKEMSLRAHTFFYGSMLTSNRILEMAYLWLLKMNHEQICDFTGIAKNSITQFNCHFQILVGGALDEEDCLIGGDGIVVEIDETKMGKRKYHRGHHVEEVWIGGGEVKKIIELRMFLKAVENRSTETMKKLIENPVKVGSIIRTDMWKAYGFLKNDPNYVHQEVKHSKHLKYPISGVHTNTIEGSWSGLKRGIKIKNRVREGMDDHLFEFMWRRKNKEKLWQAFIEALAFIHYNIS